MSGVAPLRRDDPVRDREQKKGRRNAVSETDSQMLDDRVVALGALGDQLHEPEREVVLDGGIGRGLGGVGHGRETGSIGVTRYALLPTIITPAETLR